MCATNIFIFVVSRWPRRPRHRKHASTGSGIWNRGAFSAVSESHVGQDPREFQRGLSGRSSHLHVLDARPCTRRAAMYSTRGGNASFDPTLAGAIAIMAVAEKFGAGIGARNHSINILKSRRRVWSLRRHRPRAIGLPVTAASRNDRLQALPQLTSPERLG